MKFYYIIFNIFLLLMTSVLVFLHLRHKQPESPNSLKLTPQKANQFTQGRWNNIDAPSLNRNINLADSDLFEPQRGYTPPPVKEPEKKELTQAEKENLELTGVLIINNKPVAFIENKNPNAKNLTLYHVNDQLQDYTIKAIEFNKVILTQGLKEVELVLDRKDKQSLARNNNPGYNYNASRTSVKTKPKSPAQLQIERLNRIKEARKEKFRK